MKKYLQYILIATISAVLLSACNKDEDNTVTLTAIVADQLNGGNAKVYINETGGFAYGCWQNGDTVSINGAKKYLTVTSGESLTAAINDVDASNSGYTAGYPYGKTTYGGTPKSISIDIPAVQEYISADDYSGTGASAKQRLLCPMAAYCGSNGSSLKFHNVGAVLKVTVSNSYEELLTLHSVEVESEDATVPLSGTCSVTMNDAGEISEATYEGISKTTLDLSNAGKSLAKNGDPIDLYIPIMPIKESKRTKITIHVYAKGTPDGASSENKYTFHGTSASTVWVDCNQIGAVSIELSSSNKTANDPYFWGQGNSWCPFLIEDYEDLKQLSALVAVEDNDGTYNHSNCYYKQTKDITITDANWGTSSRLAVGSTTNAFKAKYDGGNHTITFSGITSVESGYPVGVFGVVGGGASISNLTVAGNINLGDSYGDIDAGGVAGKVTGAATFMSCTNQATVTSTYTTAANYGVGGICGTIDATDATVTFTSCTNSAQIKAYGLKNGGIVGFNSNGTMNFSSCTNSGSIVSYDGSSTYYDYCGGIIGSVSSSSGTILLENCSNSGNITGNGSVGGFVGVINRACEVTGTSSNNGDIEAKGASVGGIIGSVQEKATVTIHGTSTTNNNPIEGGYDVAGIVGFTNGAITLENCYNLADITATVNGGTPKNGFYGVAGILARIEAGSTYKMTIKHCKNTCSITSTAGGKTQTVGGIVGSAMVKQGSLLINCYNLGAITGNEKYIGGIAGQTARLIVANCYNHGNLSGTLYVDGACGGITGRAEGQSSGSEGHINNCYNLGTMTEISGLGTVKHKCEICSYTGYSYASNCYGITDVLKCDYFKTAAGVYKPNSGYLYESRTFNSSNGILGSDVYMTDFKITSKPSQVGTSYSNLRPALVAWCTRNSSYAPDGGWSTWSEDAIPTFDW